MNIDKYLTSLASSLNLSDAFMHHYVYLLLILLVAGVIGLMVKRLLAPAIMTITKKTSMKSDDYLFTGNVFPVLSRLLPAIFVSLALPLCYIDKESSVFYIVCYRGINAYIVIAFAQLISVILSNYLSFTKSEHYDRDNHYADVAVQFLKVVLYFFTFIIVLSVVLDKNPTTMLAGLGAMATILLLVFQDTILGFVAGVQLSANKMLKVGDWVELKDSNINGYVTSVNLTTIKIRNFDNSTSTIQPYKLVKDTFRNWESIKDYGGRQARLKIMIDVDTVRFADDEMMQKLEQKGLLVKNGEAAQYGKVANVTLYRKYVESFLNSNDMVDSERWLMVRQTQNEGFGMPLEMYFYIKEPEFVKFEEHSAAIYEYCVAMASEFDLKIYQSLSSSRYKNVQ